jgi:UDP-N-acetylmuramoyl-L-alanyl-D-glutamate--2,6-diaminopimelate ligase
MSTSTPGGACSTVSLRSLLREAVFVGAEDIRARRCVHKVDHCRVGDIYVPMQGASADGHDEVEEAVRRGAAAVVAERLMPVSVPQCLVDSTPIAYGKICQALAGSPSKRMLTIGVVGTHGKTTTSLFLSAMLKRLGGQVAYYTSLGASDSTSCDRTAVRPPATQKLAKWLKQADLAGAPAAVIELAPSMLQNHVTSGVEFDLLVVTGMRPSQLCGSQNLKNYQLSLEEVINQMKSHGMLLYNADDAYATRWAGKSSLPAIGYGLDASQNVRAKRLSRAGGEQQLLTVVGNMVMPLTLKMPGDHIARAALAGVAAGWMFDLPVAEAIAGVESLQSIPGRMQRVAQSVDVPLYIDAGETPDRVAIALHALQKHQLGPTTAVVDVSSRLHPQWRGRLGEVLDLAASRVVLSASGCSAANAQSVIMDVLGGFRCPGRVQVIADREAAIHWAVKHTQAGSILLSGCGSMPWLDANDNLSSDEMVAKAAVESKDYRPIAPILGIFPPTSPTAFFSH